MSRPTFFSGLAQASEMHEHSWKYHQRGMGIFLPFPGVSIHPTRGNFYALSIILLSQLSLWIIRDKILGWSSRCLNLSVNFIVRPHQYVCILYLLKKHFTNYSYKKTITPLPFVTRKIMLEFIRLIFLIARNIRISTHIIS